MASPHPYPPPPPAAGGPILSGSSVPASAPAPTAPTAGPLPSPPHLPSSRARQCFILSLRYILSPKEYAALRKILKFRAPSRISNAVPSRREFDAVIKHAARKSSLSEDVGVGASGDRSSGGGGAMGPGGPQDEYDFDFIPSATRAAIRTFILAKAGLEAWAAIGRLLQRRKGIVVRRPVYPRFHSPSTRAALSVSLILFLHRLLSRFLTTLRSNLLLPSAKTFRKRHPKATRLLTSRLSPALGASLAGLALAIHPEGEMRSGIAVWMVCKALEYAWNLAEDRGVIGDRPWWFGSWLLFPLAQAQLFHALIFDRDCFPEGPGKFILNYSTQYIPQRPDTYPARLRWPGTYEVLDGVANVANLGYPKFTSPLLSPTPPLPTSLAPLHPITNTVHPLTTRLHCAITHPSEPSCLTTYIHHILHQFPRLYKFFFCLYLVASLPRYKLFLKNPVCTSKRLLKGAAASAAFVTGAAGGSWGVLCAMQRMLPGNVGTTGGGRVYLAGAVAGLWAFVQAYGNATWPSPHSSPSSTPSFSSPPSSSSSGSEGTKTRPQTAGRAAFTYASRLALVSLWKTGVKHGWWKPVRNGDVVLFVAALGLMSALWEAGGERGVSEGWVRRGLKALKGGERAVEERRRETDREYKKEV
ncbi:hypothetical protein BDZ91DRAFT_172521 [Kalaharituber pfeilii]|nr:hypothetical protein BDZ91DRAFT_172521 [Kalaharituber pfeilii]